MDKEKLEELYEILNTSENKKEIENTERQVIKIESNYRRSKKNEISCRNCIYSELDIKERKWYCKNNKQFNYIIRPSMTCKEATNNKNN